MIKSNAHIDGWYRKFRHGLREKFKRVSYNVKERRKKERKKKGAINKCEKKL